MANQRLKSKKQCGGYLDTTIIAAVQESPQGQTQFFEECVIRGLLRRRKLTKSAIIALHEKRSIHPTTFENLRADKLV